MHVRLGSLVKDKSLTHLLVKNVSPAVEAVKTPNKLGGFEKMVQMFGSSSWYKRVDD